MNNLVKILVDEDGIKVDNPVWCVVHHPDGSNRTLCTGEVFGYGESGVIYEVKSCKRGITCSECRALIKYYKSIKL